MQSAADPEPCQNHAVCVLGGVPDRILDSVATIGQKHRTVTEVSPMAKHNYDLVLLSSGDGVFGERQGFWRVIGV